MTSTFILDHFSRFSFSMSLLAALPSQYHLALWLSGNFSTDILSTVPLSPRHFKTGASLSLGAHPTRHPCDGPYAVSVFVGC